MAGKQRQTLCDSEIPSFGLHCTQLHALPPELDDIILLALAFDCKTCQPNMNIRRYG